MQVIAILGQDENGDTVQVEVVNQAVFGGDNKEGLENLVTITEDIQIEMETPDGSVQTITVPASSLGQPHHPALSSPTKQSHSSERRRQLSGRLGPGGGTASPAKRVCGAGRGETGEEAGATLSFTDWLASVTERINQTMHYQFDGHPEPLVFHAPQVREYAQALQPQQNLCLLLLF